MPGKFVQLKRGNDWGYEYFAVHPLTPNKQSCASLALVFKEDQELSVCWPDKTQSTEFIKMKKFTQIIRDHGYTDNVESFLPGIEINFHGVKTWIPLDYKGLLVKLDN